MASPGPAASSTYTRLKWTAVIVCVVLALVGALLGLRSPQLHQYEYQEDFYPALDGSASVYISASLPALVALHGMNLPTDRWARVDKSTFQQVFAGKGVTVSAVSTWRRWGRRFVTVRVDTDNLAHLPASPAFARHSFAFGRGAASYQLIERLGPSENRPVGNVGWTGSELVGFRWHIPSKVERFEPPAPDGTLLRGNILVWEQSLKNRLAGAPLTMLVVMQPQSILSDALWLFATSAVSALIVVVLILWWVVRRGKAKTAVVSRQ